MKLLLTSVLLAATVAAVNARPDAPAPTTYKYSQSTGVLSGGSANKPVRSQGYSGSNSNVPYRGVNNPAAESVRNTGPIPRGNYDATACTTSKGPNTVVLRPSTGTNTYGRDSLRVHGDNAQRNQTASHGCIIATPQARQQICNDIKAGKEVKVHVTR